MILLFLKCNSHVRPFYIRDPVDELPIGSVLCFLDDDDDGNDKDFRGITWNSLSSSLT